MNRSSATALPTAANSLTSSAQHRKKNGSSPAAATAAAEGMEPREAAGSPLESTVTTSIDREGSRPKPMIGNINSPSVSMASVSSDDNSNESNPKLPSAAVSSGGCMSIDSSDARYLNTELARLTEALERLRRAFQDTSERRDVTRKITTERLGDMLKTLRPILDRYPVLQTDAVMACASHVIDTVTTFNNSTYAFDYTNATVDFFEALESLKQALSDSVSGCIILTDKPAEAGSHNDFDASGKVRQIVFPTEGQFLLPEIHDESQHHHHNYHPGDLDFTKDFLMASKELLAPVLTTSDIGSVDQVDDLLVRHDRGVDLALDRAKLWSKYAKDVLTYVEKRMAIELDWVKNLAKLAQERRPVLKEESYLPFQSMYCMALDVDLEVCSKTQQTCSLLQDCKFIEPLKQQRAKHDNMRKSLRDKWNKERKRLQNAVIQLKKAKELYMQRHQEYERCHEAVRIAEQGMEIGATEGNKVDKRKRNEEEAMAKTNECEIQYRLGVDEANERHRNILHVKTEILREVRELIVECDRVMKEVTVNYFQHMHALLDSVPTQYLTLCENSRLYEPGNQFLEYVRQMPDSQFLQASMSDPFSFEPITGELSTSEQHRSSRDYSSSSRRTKTTSLGSLDSSSYSDHHHHHSRTLLEPLEAAQPHYRGGAATAGGGGTRREAWIPSMGAIDPSDTESVDSERSSPSGSPLVGNAVAAAASSAPPKQSSLPPAPDHHPVGHYSHRSQPVIYYDDSTDHPRADAEKGQGQRGSYLASSSRPHDHMHDQTSSSAVSAVSAAQPSTTSPTTPPRKVPMSKAASQHDFRKVKTPSKCRDCDNIIMYFNGYECSKCGLAAHKKCFESLVLLCNRHRFPSRKMQCFGQDLRDYAHLSLIPLMIIRCVEEIDIRGLDLQGIYRVSAAQKRIEKMYTNLEWGAELVDFDAFPPHVIADVLKKFLKQLPEPLLTAQLCPDFIQIADTYSLTCSSQASPTTTSTTALSSSASNMTMTSSSSGGSGPAAAVAAEAGGVMAPLAVAESSSNSPPTQSMSSSGSGVTSDQLSNSVSSSEDPHLIAAINKLKELCRKLPKPNFNSVNFLMHHLGRVAAKSENNSMTASNLAIVFAPNLLLSNVEIKDIKDIGAVDGTKNHFRVIELMILHAPLIMGPPEQVSARKVLQQISAGSSGGHGNKHHHHRGPRGGQHRTTKHRGSRGLESSDLISSQTERRSEVPHDDFAALPGLVNSSEDQTGGSTEDIFGASVSEDDDDINNDDKPLIIKQSLRNFSGLEGVTPSMLSTQDSMEVAKAASNTANSAAAAAAMATAAAPMSSSLPTAATAKRTVHHESNMVASEVFHKVTMVPKPSTKKHSIEDNDSPDQLDGGGGRETTETTETSGFKSNPRSGSLSEEASSAQRRSRGTSSTMSLTSQSIPTSTILNLEENRVTIQVPGVSSTVHHRTSHHPTVIKQTSLDKEGE